MIGCIIQARMGSSRLPKKSMKKIRNQPILYYVLEQIKKSQHIDKIVVATTFKKEDNEIINFLKKKKIPYFRGKSDDVLDRYYKCAKKYSFSIIVRITADNPLIDFSIVDRVIQKFLSNECDIVTNTVPRTFPYGTEVEVFSFNALKQAWHHATNSTDREHVTAYLYSNSKKFKILSLKNKKNYSKFRYTLDEIQDYDLIKNIILNIKKRPILMNDVIDYLRKNPDILELNKNVKHRNLDIDTK